MFLTFAYGLIYVGAALILLPPLLFSPPPGRRLNKPYYMFSWCSIGGLSLMLSSSIPLGICGFLIALVGIVGNSKSRGELYV